MFDTGLSVTPLMGHLGCLTSRWSVPVLLISSPKIIHTDIFQILGLYTKRRKTRSVQRLKSGKKKQNPRQLRYCKTSRYQVTYSHIHVTNLKLVTCMQKMTQAESVFLGIIAPCLRQSLTRPPCGVTPIAVADWLLNLNLNHRWREIVITSQSQAITFP